MHSDDRQCPIPDCNWNAGKPTRSGWNGHIVAVRNHPDWHPEIADKEERKRRFREEFPQWFRDRSAPRSSP